MKKCPHLAVSVFASVFMGFCAQNALAAERAPYEIEDRGDLSSLKENLEIQCRDNNGEVLQSYEVGPRTKTVHSVNGRRRTTIETVWKVLCKRQHIVGKMPAVVIALENGNALSRSTTLDPKVREELLSAAAKDDGNCASKLVQLVKKLKQDSDISSASKELEQLMGTFTVAITVDPGTEKRSGSLPGLLDTSDYNHVERISILTPDYELLGEIDPKWTGADGKPNSVEKTEQLQYSSCTVGKKDILGLIHRMIKEKKMQKEQEGVLSSRKIAKRVVASTPEKGPEKSISASFVDSPALFQDQAQ
jgi:hypothetical protein